jgi:hypothetical protein
MRPHFARRLEGSLPAAGRVGGADTMAAIGATYRDTIDFSNLDGPLAVEPNAQYRLLLRAGE